MSDGSIIIDTRIDSRGAESGINSLGGMAQKGLGVITKATAVMATGIAAATVAVGGLVKASIEQYSQYEQLTGGVETLFKNSSNVVMDYANNAYKTAGMSANEYMSTITGFSASLLQGLGGDTAKAADVGNMAVTDMSDNANKMGTSMEMIQNAYQGFAKQNYTMLDNLKLGYGGTKTEMERLLTDAEKISGVKYNISNFSDVISAIHVVQNEMGITGTTMKEASSTIEGSLNMTKAAWKNLLTGMADDNANFDTLINNFVDSAGSFGSNILPRIEIAINGVAQLIEKLLPPIMDKIPQLILNVLPKLISAGMQVIQNLVTGIQQNLPTLATSVVNIVTTLATGILTLLPQVVAVGLQIIGELQKGMAQAYPTLIPAMANCIVSLVNAIATNLPMVIDGGIAMLKGIVDGIIQALPILIAALPEIINNIVLAINYGLPQILQCAVQIIQSLVDGIVQNLPLLMSQLPEIINTIITVITENLSLILDAGLQILLALINGIIECLPQLIAMLPQIIETIITFLTENMPQIIDMGIEVLLALIDGLINALPQLIAMLPQIINAITTGLLNHLPELIQAGVQIIVALAGGLLQALPQLIGAIPDIIIALKNAFVSVNWGEIGSNILKGIGTGITSAITGMVEVGIKACTSLKDSIKAFFDIHSPSRVMRDEVGKNIINGIGVGLVQQLPQLIATAKSACNQLNSTIKKELNANTAQEYLNNISSVSGTFSALANEITKANEELKNANNADVMDNVDYSNLYYKVEDIKGKIDEAKEAGNKSLEKTLETQKKALEKELSLNKEILQKEISTRKEMAKEAVSIAKEKEEKLKDLASATVDAIKSKLQEEKTATLNAISKEMDAEEDAYNKKISRIDKTTEKKKSALQDELKALEDVAEEEDRQKERQEALNNIAVLKAKMDNNASEADKKALAMKIKNAQTALAEKESDWNREDEKAKIQEEIAEVEEKANAKKSALKEEYEATKESYEKQKEEAEEYYSKLLETDALNAQARYMLLQGNSNELVNLLQSYNPLWQNAGQSLADSLLYGLNSKKNDMKDAVEEMMSLTGGKLSDNESSNTYYDVQAGEYKGYETGTSYNSVSGLYNVDEKGFELSTGNSVAYVGKGAGILNHMQSLAAIKDEVAAQVSKYAEKLRSAVAFDQYKMGQLALATNNSYGGNVNNDNSSINFNVEHYHNDKRDSIEKTANELGFYARRKKKP